MKKSRKKISVIISIILLFAIIIPMLNSCILANEKISISTIELNCDMEKTALNVAYTEGEVNKRILNNNVATATEGININFGNTGLRYFNNPENPASTIYGIGSGTNQVVANREYVICFLLQLKDEYDFAESIKNTFNATNKLITEGEGLTIKLNNEVKNDTFVEYNATSNFLRIYIPIGKPSTNPIVTGITIDDNDLSMQIGTNHTFGANVTGTIDDKTVIWSIEGANSLNTVVDESGNLTIGNDETAETITLKATSHFDNTKTDTRTITITQEVPTIESVAITPEATSLYTKENKRFTANVEGTQVDKRVSWSIEGANSANTVISNDGLLTIGSDETAETITVKATAIKDPSKTGTATVTILQPIRISVLDLSFNTDNIAIDTTKTEGELNQIILNNIGVLTEGCSVDSSNSGLIYFIGEVPNGIKNGADQVSADKNYYLEYNIKLAAKHDWLENDKNIFKTGNKLITQCDDLTLKVNNIKREDAILSYNSYWNELRIYIPLCKEHTYLSGIVKEATCKEVGTKKYTCSKCGKNYSEEIEKLAHTYKTTTNITKATISKDGKIETITMCSKCGDKTTKSVAIPYPKTISLSKTEFKYNKKIQKPTVIIKGSDGKAIATSNYTVKYSNSSSKKVGRYSVTITFKGNYIGTKTLNYDIKPKGISISKLTKGSKQFKATWSKNKTETTGYELQYATNSTFSSGKKSVKIAKNKTTSTIIKKLKGNKKYFVRIRTYKTVKFSGKNIKIYSGWSKVLNVKTKK